MKEKPVCWKKEVASQTQRAGVVGPSEPGGTLRECDTQHVCPVVLPPVLGAHGLVRKQFRLV